VARSLRRDIAQPTPFRCACSWTTGRT
jgi:hypothetical protein